MTPAPDGHRRRRHAEAPAEQTFADLMNGFSLDSGRRKVRRVAPPPRTNPREESPSVAHEDWPTIADEPLAPAAPIPPAASIVRAYAYTGGRTRSNVNLEIETLVSANDQAHQSAGMLQAEHQQIIELCRAPRSVAEVAALMRIPLGVAKVLLGDLAERGLVDVHLTATSAGGDMPDLGLMERVLSGLRRL
ncbi:hypothetical protein Lesp02_09580 [Lentzea sp. NBRC 105346]|uniref:DUF742 domain-containing protein n=1 Tax=Lentzea sp. NBRC 105346 TaxID=3032205 RepID=UPI00249F9969|nr:DUF742 domain-containing protein [Lentzea sp. NBRC 105346]GLZ28768.1 hypothetical protein Lesp02_09580 [Lentzea sp. NBRC 105346]